MFCILPPVWFVAGKERDCEHMLVSGFCCAAQCQSIRCSLNNFAVS